MIKWVISKTWSKQDAIAWYGYVEFVKVETKDKEAK